MQITFIGAGTMGEAMIRGLLHNNVAKVEEIIVSDINQTRRNTLSSQYGVRTMEDNKSASAQGDMIILAVKPQDLGKIIEQVGTLKPEQCVLSIMAGVKLSELCDRIKHHSVIRAMPNMPAQIGQGISVWIASSEVSAQQKKMAESILSSLGQQIQVTEEKYLDMATALSGSGPAYVFLFIETLIDAGVHIGLSRDVSEKLVMQTALGSILTLQQSSKHPAELRNLVTSPGGTTTEALLKLEEGGLRSLFIEAVTAAYNKAKHM